MQIADHAHNPTGALGGGIEFLRGLDETERQRQCTMNFFFAQNDRTDVRLHVQYFELLMTARRRPAFGREK